MAELQYESRIYRITGTTPILGSLPAKKSIRTDYIISKAPDRAAREAEETNPIDLDEKGLTIFSRDVNERICIRGYQVKGFLKHGIKTLKLQLGVANAGTKVDNLVFIEPNFIPLLRDGQPILDEDDVLERPLRAQTAQGERVTLAASEMINDPWTAEFEVTLVPNSGTKASAELTWDAIETAMEYGMFHGLGQWRNADYGKFRFERVS